MMIVPIHADKCAKDCGDRRSSPNMVNGSGKSEVGKKSSPTAHTISSVRWWTLTPTRESQPHKPCNTLFSRKFQTWSWLRTKERRSDDRQRNRVSNEIQGLTQIDRGPIDFIVSNELDLQNVYLANCYHRSSIVGEWEVRFQFWRGKNWYSTKDWIKEIIKILYCQQIHWPQALPLYGIIHK